MGLVAKPKKGENESQGTLSEGEATIHPYSLLR